MDTLNKSILKLYTEYHTVYGPYKRKEDGRDMIILYDGKRRSARLVAKVKLEIKLNRKLKQGEEVDHINNDRTDDSYDNLQLLSSTANRQKTAKYSIEDKTKVCPQCKRQFVAVHIKQKFCSRRCSGKYNNFDLGVRTNFNRL